MSASILHSWWTVVMLITFVGIVLWAWSAKRKTEFDSASQIPLLDDEPGERNE